MAFPSHCLHSLKLLSQSRLFADIVCCNFNLKSLDFHDVFLIEILELLIVRLFTLDHFNSPDDCCLLPLQLDLKFINPLLELVDLMSTFLTGRCGGSDALESWLE